MKKNEKRFVVFYYLYILIYLPIFFYNIEKMPGVLVPFHLIGMGLSLLFIIILVRDILKREFAGPNEKIAWILLILFFWPLSVLYVIKYGFKPRGQSGD
jgi:hypothetical protein